LNIHGCHAQANCTNTIGSYECHCKPGYVGDGSNCSPCGENEYSFNETTCLSCPQNSTGLSASPSILSCKCRDFNHYPDSNSSLCRPCEDGFLLDEISNICKSNYSIFLKNKNSKNKNKNKNKNK